MYLDRELDDVDDDNEWCVLVDVNTIQLDCWRCVNEFVTTLELFDAIVPVVFVVVVIVVVAGVDDDDEDVPCGLNVTGTKCGVRLDIGGNIGLVGHWYDGVVADGSLLKM